MFDVVTLGSATKDVFLISKQFKLLKSDQFSTGIGECVPLGSKIELDQTVLTTGGGGTNTAATFAHLGYKTAVISRIGNDSTAKEILEDLRARNISTTYIKQLKKGSTGYSTLLTTPEGERSVLVDRGVSADFSLRDIPKELKTKWVYISSVAGNIQLAQTLTRRLKKQGVKIAYNPGSLELKHGIRAFELILRNIDILMINLEEAQILTKSKTRDISLLVKKIAKKDLTLLITDGRNGAYASAHGTIWHARTTGATGISRTGAGDAFGSGFVAAQIKGMSLAESLQVGTLNAEAVIQKHGAKFGLLTRWPSKQQRARVKVREL